MDRIRPQEHRPVVVAPTFNNARTLTNILRRIDDLKMDVIVVNDGSTDETDRILQDWHASDASSRRVVLTHPTNLGKAAALLSAFAHSASAGYTHAITIDTDGQLEPEQIPLLDEQARQNPDAMIIGSRDASAEDYPGRSRLGRWVSNLLLRWEAGAITSDSQCGFRVYPLKTMSRLRCRSGRYGFETEVLARAAWAGVELRQIPVRCIYQLPEGRVTHFRPWRDSLSAVGMHLQLLGRSALPWPADRIGAAETGTAWRRFVQWISPIAALRAARRHPAARTRLAAGLAAGVFIANLPLYGVQSALSLIVARLLRFHPLTVLTGSHLSTPPFGAVLVAASIATGHFLLHGTTPHLADFNPRATGYFSLGRSVLIEWTLGGIVCGLMLGAATFALSRLLMELEWPRRRPRQERRTPASAVIHQAAPVPIRDS